MPKKTKEEYRAFHRKLLKIWDPKLGGSRPSASEIEAARLCGYDEGRSGFLSLALGFRSEGSNSNERTYANDGEPAENVGGLDKFLHNQHGSSRNISGENRQVDVNGVVVYVRSNGGSHRKFSFAAEDTTSESETGDQTADDTRSITIERLTDAIDDIGTDTPSGSKYSGVRYARDPKIREAVMQRAGGKCEFCGEIGFECTNGTRYLECHHIVALANDGADRMTNVIALCPRDHREAHFGMRLAEIEVRMIDKVKAIVAATASSDD